LVEELLRLYQKLSEYVGGYDEESYWVVKKILDAINAIDALIKEPYYRETLRGIGIAIRLIWLDRTIRTECADVITHGDVHNPCPVERYIERQRPFVEAFDRYRHGLIECGLGDGDRQFISETVNYIFAEQESTIKRYVDRSARTDSPLSEDDELLHAVAGFMNEGNKLFDILRKKEAAGDFLKCLLTSYERLRNYCEIVGEKKIAAECIDRIVAIRQELSEAGEVDGGEDSRAGRGIKSLLGLTTRGSGKYDVFISFKSEDNALAKAVYDFLKMNLVEGFWSKVSLPELSRADYGEAIDQALDNSRHMVVVLSDLRYLESKWVKYEVKTFADEIREGRKEGANLLILATDQVYDEIIASNKKVLPIQYRWCQILKMSDFRGTLLQYVRK